MSSGPATLRTRPQVARVAAAGCLVAGYDLSLETQKKQRDGPAAFRLRCRIDFHMHASILS